MDELKDITYLQLLLEAKAPSAFETDATMIFRQFITPYADSFSNDNMGNTIASQNSSAEFHILLSAHIDEVGLQITDVSNNGMLKVRKIGGVKSSDLLGQKVHLVLPNETVEGVVVAQNMESCNSFPDIDDLFIDVYGMREPNSRRQIPIGTYATFEPRVCFSNDLLVSKSIDDRVGVYIISQLFRELHNSLKNIQLSVAATVQEEIGLRGMAAVAQETHPDLCLNLDVTNAATFNTKLSSVFMDNGPVFYLNADSNRLLVNSLHGYAHKRGKPIQMSIGREITGGTDASRAQLFSPHTAVAEVDIPCRYVHSAHEICSIKDILTTIDLLKSYIQHLDAQLSENPFLNFCY